jgi:hypothetical protein
MPVWGTGPIKFERSTVPNVSHSIIYLWMSIRIWILNLAQHTRMEQISTLHVAPTWGRGPSRPYWSLASKWWTGSKIPHDQRYMPVILRPQQIIKPGCEWKICIKVWWISAFRFSKSWRALILRTPQPLNDAWKRSRCIKDQSRCPPGLHTVAGAWYSPIWHARHARSYKKYGYHFHGDQNCCKNVLGGRGSVKCMAPYRQCILCTVQHSSGSRMYFLKPWKIPCDHKI